MNPEIPLIFKDFSSVINFRMQLFENKKFVRSMFPPMKSANRKWLHRFNKVIKLFKYHVGKVGTPTAMIDYSKVFNKQNTGKRINRFLKHVELINQMLMI